MGMIFYGRRLTADELARVTADPDAAPELLHDDAADRALDLDKAWHAIHFLLTGSDYDTSDGAGEAILGGEPVGDEPEAQPRLLSAERVRGIAAGLAGVGEDDLRSRYDAAALDERAIYPNIWDEGDDALDYVLPYYTDLRAFYATAAEHGEATLVVIS